MDLHLACAASPAAYSGLWPEGPVLGNLMSRGLASPPCREAAEAAGLGRGREGLTAQLSGRIRQLPDRCLLPSSILISGSRPQGVGTSSLGQGVVCKPMLPQTPIANANYSAGHPCVQGLTQSLRGGASVCPCLPLKETSLSCYRGGHGCRDPAPATYLERSSLG